MSSSINGGSERSSIGGRAKAFARARRRWLIGAFAVLFLYTIAGFFLVPAIAKGQIVATLEATFQRPVTLAELRFNPFTLSADARDFSLTETDGAGLIAFDRLFINFQTSSLFRWAWTFREIRLEGPEIELVRDAGGAINLAALSSAGGDESGPAEQDSSPPRLVIGSFTLANGVMNVTDRVPASEFVTVVGPVSVAVSDLSTLPDREGQQQVVINTEGGSRLEWSGTVQVNPPLSSGRVTGSGPFMPILSRYLQDRMAFSASDGRVELGFAYRVGTDAQGERFASVDGLDIAVLDVTLQRDDETTAFLSVPAVRASGGTLRWPQSTARVERLLVEGVSLSANRSPDGIVNLQNLLVATEGVDEATATGATLEDGDVSSWSVELGELAVTDLAASFTDSAIREPGTLRIADLDLTVREISNADRAQSPFELAISIASGGRIRGSGDVVVLPEPALDGTFSVDALDLSAAQPYFSDMARVTLDGGALSAEGTATSNAEQPIQVAGSLSVQGLEVSDADQGERLIGWENLGVDMFTFDQAARTLEISEVALQSPYARLFIDAGGNTNFQELVVSSEPEEGAATEAAPDPQPERDVDGGGGAYTVSLGRLRIEDGASDFTDLSLPLPFATNMSALNGELSALVTSSAEPAQLVLEGQIEEFGLAQIEGSIHPQGPGEFLDIQMLFRNVAMPDLSPYTAQFAGRTIDDGSLELNLHYAIEAGGLAGENDIVISDLALGERVEHPDAMDLPLDLAVALLTGPDGRIDLDLPVRGDLNDPQFRISSLVMTAFGNLITGLVTSPFRLLGRLIGVESENFDRIEFEPGDAELTPPEREKLIQLADALMQRPNLGLIVPGVVAAEADTAAVKIDRVDARIDAGIEAAIGEFGAEVTLLARRRQILESLYAQTISGQPLEELQAEFMQPQDPTIPESPPMLDEAAYLAALREQLIEVEPVSEADLDALASARAEAIRAALTTDGAVAPSRIEFGEHTTASLNDAGWVPLRLDIGRFGGD